MELHPTTEALTEAKARYDQASAAALEAKDDLNAAAAKHRAAMITAILLNTDPRDYAIKAAPFGVSEGMIRYVRRNLAEAFEDVINSSDISEEAWAALAERFGVSEDVIRNAWAVLNDQEGSHATTSPTA